MLNFKHYKMFKKGKKWYIIALVTVGVVLGTLATMNINADTSNTNGLAVTTTTNAVKGSVNANSSAESVDKDSIANNEVVVDSTSASSVNSVAKFASGSNSASNITNNLAQPARTQAVVNSKLAALSPKRQLVTGPDGKVSYYNDNGQKVVGRGNTASTLAYQTVNGKTYAFDNAGNAYVGFLPGWGRLYYFGNNGARYTNQWYYNWGHYYYFGSDGARLTDQFLNSKQLPTNNGGIVNTNQNHVFYFNPSTGIMAQNQFYNNWGHTYYFGSDGARYTNQFYNNWGHTYYFGNDGARWDNRFYNNWGHTYYFGNDGARWDNRFYNNWGHTYYFQDDGSLATNSNIWINGSEYHADSNGILSPITIYNNRINGYILRHGISPVSITYGYWGYWNSHWGHYFIPNVTGKYSGTYNGKPNMIIVHETANPNDSISGEIRFELSNYNNAFVHAFVDNNHIIQISNTDHEAWGACYPANGRAIQFEQVEVYGAWNFARELVNAAYYTAYNMKKYGLIPSLAQPNGTGTLWSHHNVSQYLGGTDHTDPDGYWWRNARNYFGTNYSMGDFLQLVNYEYSKIN